mgnify:CR=1 FL=1
MKDDVRRHIKAWERLLPHDDNLVRKKLIKERIEFLKTNNRLK